MNIKRFKAQNFRNIEECDIEFSPGVNLLYGKNAEGKTNAIEGIYLFSRGKSFRSADDRDMIRFDTDGFRISVDYENNDGQNSLEYACFGRERLRKKNGYKISKASEMIGNFKSVLFYPDNLDLIKDGPEERRSFLNIAVSQCYTTYIDDYSKFKIALENRNSLLKMASKSCFIDDRELYAWSESMAEYASFIYCKRLEYIKNLEVYVKKIGFDLSSQREDITLSYKNDIDEEIFERQRVKEKYIEKFTSSLEKEKIVGTSLYGPQRDDILININGHQARNFASQGQQRSIVLVIKLAEGEVIKNMFGEYPVFLFDDVLSELDKDRRNFVINGMGDRQVIITSCEGEELLDGADKIINVVGGKYVSSYR